MKIVKTKKALAECLNSFRTQGRMITLVPTMGALHTGHLSLLRLALETDNGIVVCSIFVNPTQFNDPEDLQKYPRPIEQDIALLEQVGCDVLFLPEVSEMYGEQEEWSMDLGMLDQVWEGAQRPGHFQGVTQIVYKLFEAVQPDRAIFGQKDLQQYLVIEEMVRQKGLPVQLMMAPTVRDDKGLALSSRNVRLSPTGRQQALVLNQSLRHVVEGLSRWEAGETSLQTLQREAMDLLEKAPGVHVEYFTICDRRTLLPAEENIETTNIVVLVAAWVEGVRLIDNMVVT